MVTHYAFRPISKIPIIGVSTIYLFLLSPLILKPQSVVSRLLHIGFAAIFGYLFIRTIFLKNYVTVTPDSLIIRKVLYNQKILLKNIKKVTVYDDEYSFFQQKRIVFKLSWWRDVRLAKACVKSSDWPSLVNWAVNLQPQQ
jgi:hypothetical protein